MAKEIERAVDTILKKYPTGPAFFSALDEALREPVYINLATKYAYTEKPFSRFLVTGKFGEAFRDWRRQESGRDDVLLVEGDLRHDTLTPIGKDQVWLGEPFIFLDDSIYRGRTRSQIIRSLSLAGGHTVGSLVLYDGGHEPFEGVRSLYSWRERIAHAQVAQR